MKYRCWPLPSSLCPDGRCQAARTSRITPWQEHPYSVPRQQNWTSLLSKAALTNPPLWKIQVFCQSLAARAVVNRGAGKKPGSDVLSSWNVTKRLNGLFIVTPRRTNPKVQMFQFNIIISPPYSYNSHVKIWTIHFPKCNSTSEHQSLHEWWKQCNLVSTPLVFVVPQKILAHKCTTFMMDKIKPIWQMVSCKWFL